MTDDRYVAMVGMASCMPEWSYEADTVQEARDALIENVDPDKQLLTDFRYQLESLASDGDEAMPLYDEMFVQDTPHEVSDYPSEKTSTWYAEIVKKAPPSRSYEPYALPSLVGKQVTKVINGHIFQGHVTQAMVHPNDIHVMVVWANITEWVPSNLLEGAPPDPKYAADNQTLRGFYTKNPLGPQICTYLKADVRDGKLTVLVFFETLTTPERFSQLGFDANGDKIG